MSKFVKVKTELRDLGMIKLALHDLALDFQENSRYVHPYSGFAAVLPLVVKTQHLTFGLRETEGGVFEVVGDDMQVKSIQATLQKLQQRYAYHKVVAEVSRAGFDLVEESVGRDNVIRMTVRRWS